MVKVEQGQPVMVFTGYNRRRAAAPGTVTKVGRVWVDIEIQMGETWRQTSRFRLDDQTDGVGKGVRNSFMTLEQYVTHQRELEASEFLHEQGITLEFHSSWRERRVELADIIRAATVPHGTGKVDS